jgi:hypothetical protein
MPRLLRTATLTAILLAPGYSSTAGQDQTFRITNIERRLDQLQQRVDLVERQQQNQPQVRPASISPELVLEIQRQTISLQQQMVLAQEQILKLQKAVDELASQQPPKEAGKQPAPETTKPQTKAKPSRPPE